MSRTRKTLAFVIIILLFAAVGAGWYYYEKKAFVWIDADHFGVVVAQVGDEMPAGQVLARAGQRGIREEVLGPGLHRISPFIEKVQIHPMITISPGTDDRIENGAPVRGLLPQVGIVTSLTGRPLPEGEYLASPGERGIQRKVLVPGKYALNPHAFHVEPAPVTVVEAGHVGVVTHLAGTPASGDLAKPGERGTLADPLPPGLYWLNTREFKVTPMKVGYHEISFDGDNAIAFPSADGETVNVDATVVWGLLPDDVPHLVQQFGTQHVVVDNAIKPQAGSKARVAGSNYSSRQLVEGEFRERFQEEFLKKLSEELAKKRIRVMLALIRNIQVPQSVRKPIQAAKVSTEEELTNRVKTETAKVATTLSELRSLVEIESAKVKSETEKLAAEESSRGTAEVARLKAETKAKIAETLSKAETLKSEAHQLLTRAAAESADEEEAQRVASMRERYEAFGDSASYSLWRLAESLPANLKIELRDDVPSDAANAGAAGLLQSLLKNAQLK